MRIVLVALGLVILLAVGWVLKGLMSDRDERDFAVHYSWIVKWALTLSRETQLPPAGATFDSPRIEVAGHPNRWVVSGHVNWRDALGEPIGEPYTAVVENICKAYADPDCWRLEGFAIGEPAIDLAERALGAGTVEWASAELLPGSESAPKQEPAPETASPDPVLDLLNDSTPAMAEGAVPDAPAPPIAQGITLPERKPAEPVGIADVEFLIAEAIQLADADSVAVIEEASRPSVGEVDTLLALSDTGTIVGEIDSEAALEVPASPLLAERDVEVETEKGLVEEEEILATLNEPTAALPASSIGAEAAMGQSSNAPEPVDSWPEPASPLPLPQSAAIEAASVPIPTERVQSDASSDAHTGASSQTAAPSSSTAPAPEPAPDAALVVLIQDRLERAGYDPGPIDGRFGARTRAALQGFERDARLPVTGEPSQSALAALEQLLATRAAAQAAPTPRVASFPREETDAATLPVPARPSGPTALTPAAAAPARASAEPTNLIQPPPNRSAPTAADESLIFLIQHRLRQAGFTPGRFDGRMSESTENAIRAYQSEKGLTVNGVPSRALLEQLEADVFEGNRPQPLAPTPLGSIPCHVGIGPGCTAAPA